MHISRSMRRIKISRICRYLGNGSRKVCVDAVRLLRARAIQGSRKFAEKYRDFLSTQPYIMAFQSGGQQALARCASNSVTRMPRRKTTNYTFGRETSLFEG